MIVFDVRASGRVPWRTLKGITAGLPPWGGTSSPTADNVFARLVPGGCWYDRGRNMVWLNIANLGLTNIGVRVFSTVYLTQHGVIQLNATVPADGASAYSETIQRIAESVAISGGIAYQRSALETWPLLDRLDWTYPERRFIEIIVAAALVVCLVMTAVVLRKRARETGKSPLARRRRDEFDHS